MFLLIAETSSFTFHSVSSTVEKGHRALLRAWKVHCQQTGADPTYMKELIRDGGVNAHPIALEQVLRDGEVIA